MKKSIFMKLKMSVSKECQYNVLNFLEATPMTLLTRSKSMMEPKPSLIS